MFRADLGAFRATSTSRSRGHHLHHSRSAVSHSDGNRKSKMVRVSQEPKLSLSFSVYQSDASNYHDAMDEHSQGP